MTTISLVERRKDQDETWRKEAVEQLEWLIGEIKEGKIAGVWTAYLRPDGNIGRCAKWTDLTWTAHLLGALELEVADWKSQILTDAHHAQEE